MASVLGAASGGVLLDHQFSGSSKQDIRDAVDMLERQRDKVKQERNLRQSDELEKRLENIENRIKNLKSRINEKSSGDGECQTCANRKYQDGSDDPGVSFKSASKISGNVESAVRGHEQEHVTRNRAAAEREGREIVYQSVIIKRAICPECGESYVSGGETTTVTRSKPAEETSAVEGKDSEDKSAERGGSDKAVGAEAFDKIPDLSKPLNDRTDYPNKPSYEREYPARDSRFDVGLYDRQLEHGQFLNIVA